MRLARLLCFPRHSSLFCEFFECLLLSSVWFFFCFFEWNGLSENGVMDYRSEELTKKLLAWSMPTCKLPCGATGGSKLVNGQREFAINGPSFGLGWRLTAKTVRLNQFGSTQIGGLNNYSAVYPNLIFVK